MPSGTDARSPASQPFSCRSVTTTTVPWRPARCCAAAESARAVARRAEPGCACVDRAPSPACDRRPASPQSRASSANVTTPTRSPAGAFAIASFASCLARSNRPGADRLYERVERDHRDAGRADRRAGGEERPREGQRQQHQRRHAQREQQQLAQPALVGVLDRRLLDQLHRRELHARFRLALAADAARSAWPPRPRRRGTAATETTACYSDLRPGREVGQQRDLERLAGVDAAGSRCRWRRARGGSARSARPSPSR